MMLRQEPLVLDDYRDIDVLRLDQFPEAADLALRFEDDMPCLVSGALGLQIGLPWWDRADVDRWTRGEVGAPLGTAGEPFQDEEQGWRLLIWRSGDTVYVMAGDEDVFRVWFRVPAERYLAAWSAAT